MTFLHKVRAAWNHEVRLLVKLRLLRCYMCDNKGSEGGCSCGAHGVTDDGMGYSWCAVYVGCDRCGRA